MFMNGGGDMAVCAGLYRELRDASVCVIEPEARYHALDGDSLPSEHQLHLLWQRQELLCLPLMTIDQQAVTVYRPGRWSRSSGPDFRDAKLRLGDGPIRIGAVEVHVLASDWFRHGHDRDPAYTKVLVHVVWHNDLDAQTVVDASGREIPQLVLSTALTIPPTAWQDAFEDESTPSGHGVEVTPCQRSLMEMAPETVARLLDMAGEERWRQKANRFALRLERRGVEQALYETLMEALGFQGNRMLFWQLARLAPLAHIREALGAVGSTPLQGQAILYGVSGFLQHWQTARQPHTPGYDTYVDMLVSHWEAVSTLFPECLTERQWRTTGIRPANFPQRRIAAAGYWLAALTQQSLVDFCLAPLRHLAGQASRAQLRRCLGELARRLCVGGDDDFWRRRYGLEGPVLNRPVDLLGRGRATTMVVDVLLPAAAALAQLGKEPISLETVRALYICHPRLPANEVTREMLRQFFGSDRCRAAIVDSACRQQALMQLYSDFCLSELETCQECAFPRLVARLARLQKDMTPGGR
jgi:hypothetical protein